MYWVIVRIFNVFLILMRTLNGCWLFVFLIEINDRLVGFM